MKIEVSILYTISMRNQYISVDTFPRLHDTEWLDIHHVCNKSSMNCNTFIPSICYMKSQATSRMSASLLLAVSLQVAESLASECCGINRQHH